MKGYSYIDISDMELYLKAGPDGQSVGDCPFAHYVRALLAHKGLECQAVPCSPTSKPSWLIERHGGKMPCLRSGDREVTESSSIAEFINTSFPPALATGEGVREQVAGIFPATARLAK